MSDTEQSEDVEADISTLSQSRGTGIRHLPENPHDKYYLTHCYACQAIAKPQQEFIRNYGGLVCFSCRAFWRRAHQKCQNPIFVCKRGGSCSMSIKARRKCQKCRYERCKTSGMTCEAILTDEQKKIRFRKMLQKRQATLSSESGSKIASNGTLDTSLESEDFQIECDEDDVPIEELTSTINVNMFDLVSISTCLSAFLNPDSGLITTIERPFPSNEPNFGLNARPKMCRVVLQKFQTIIASYQATIGDNSNMLSEILEKSDFFGRISIEGKTELNWCIQTMTKKFEEFAYYHRHFVCLSPNDRAILLTRNTPLFIQLHLIMNLVEIRQPLADGASQEEKEESVKLNYKRFQTFANLFKEDSDVSQYEELTLKLKSLFYARSFEAQAIFAYVILFDYDSSMKIMFTEDLEDLSIMNEILYKKGIEGAPGFHTEMKGLTNLLLKMSVFCSYNLKFDEITSTALVKSQPPLQLSLVMPYTEEEEIWLRSQMGKLEDAYKSVTIGERIMQEFVLNSLGVSVTQEYYQRYMSIVEERMLKLLKIHPEFHESSLREQVDAKINNTPLGMAVVTVLGENISGMQQVQSGLGIMDEETWNREYLPVFDKPSEIKRVSLALSPKLTQNEADSFRFLTQNAREIASDMSLFKINLLLVLTCSNNPSSPLGRVHHKYVTLLKRRLEWMYERGMFPEADSASEIIHKVFSSLHSLADISRLLQIVTDSIVRQAAT